MNPFILALARAIFAALVTMKLRDLARRVSICLFLACLPLCASPQANPSTEIFYNAKIFTAEPAHPQAEAFAIRGDKIVAVGTRADVTRAIGAAAGGFDLHGRSVLPGLIDSHVHPIMGGFTLNAPNAGGWASARTVADVVAIANEAVRKGTGMQGDILMITCVPIPIWLHTDELDKKLSRGEFEKVPVLLWGADGHTGWANRALRLRVGLTREFMQELPLEQRTLYGFDTDFEPNGLAVDDGLAKIMAPLPRVSRETNLAWGESAVRYLNSLGITAWVDALATRSGLTAYRDLSERDELTAHVAAFPELKATKDTAVDDALARVQALRKEFSDVPNLTIPGIKIFADGVVEYPSQTAAMSAPFKNTGRMRQLLFDPARFAEIVTAADKAGLIVHIHAIGDKAVTESLNGIEAARKANGNSSLPHTIAHLQFVVPSDFPRFKRLGVIADMQLLWAEADYESIEMVKPYVDPAVYVWQYPARSLLNAGATISGGSDWYVSSPNPFLAIYEAETREGPEGVLNAKERIPRRTMLYAYTRNAALAMNQLNAIGSIAAGKQADFVVVDRDVLTVSAKELRNTQVLWTVLSGKTVFGERP